MAGRSRKLIDLRGDAYKRADVESADDRHPTADVTRYVNQGAAELYDLLVEARGAIYYRKSAPPITTTADTTLYALPTDFYRLISVRRTDVPGEMLQMFQAEDEPWLRDPTLGGPWPSHYQIRPGFIEILPKHDAGLTIAVDYVPIYADLVGDNDEFDGINGWEEYVTAFAARCIAIKDDQPRIVQMCDADMGRLRERILKLAPKRDAFRPERIRDVRSERRWRGW